MGCHLTNYRGIEAIMHLIRVQLSPITNLLQSCYRFVTGLLQAVTGLLQGCYRAVTACYTAVTGLLQICYRRLGVKRSQFSWKNGAFERERGEETFHKWHLGRKIARRGGGRVAALHSVAYKTRMIPLK